MTQKGLPQKRRRYFINKEFQLKFIVRFCLLILIGVIISTGLLFLFTHGTLTSSFRDSRLVIESTASAIAPAVIYTNLITLGLISLAALAVTLIVSHKIAGPVYRFEKEMREIGGGDLTKKVKLREKDQLKGMVESLNNMIASLKGKVLAIQSDVGDLITLASKENAPTGVIEELNRLQNKIGIHFKV